MAIYGNQTGTLGINTQFYADVIKGLKSRPKYLSSKYFYDKIGDKLFQRIMQTPEYYPTKCEYEIFTVKTAQMAEVLSSIGEDFDIVELGAGDATKSIHLLHHLLRAHQNFTYYPVDISENVITLLEATLPDQLRGLKMVGLHGEYFDMLKRAYELSSKPKIILFLGGNIGNFTREQANAFLWKLQSFMQQGDMILTGFDLKKNPSTILAAYNDKDGTTAAFNLNLLHRINKELNANFDLSKFTHFPTYDPLTGSCKSYLVSLRNQSVSIGDTEQIKFNAYEPIFMEIAQKYSVQEIDTLAKANGFAPVNYLFDSRAWFLDAIWRRR